jgi:glutamyl-tRNA reductase
VPGELFVVGVSWRTAPVAVRERLAFRDDELAGAVAEVRATPPVAEAMLISTCNRVEVYGVARGDGAAAAVKRALAARRGVPIGEVEGVLYDHAGPGAIRHVFQVAAALDSLVLGEAQILGQLKAAYGVATGAGATGPLLGRCLERAFGVAKRVRSETAIARGGSNVSTVAVDLAQKVFGDLTGKRVLVIGAGKMSTLAARHLRQAGVDEIVVTNRSPERAERLAAEIDGVARPWAELEDQLALADVVLSSTGARAPVLTPAMFKRVTKARRWKPIMIVDIAVPRDADPAIARRDGVYLFDIDDLERVVAANLAERAKAAEHALRIVEHEAGQFEQWLRSQRVVPTIRALREHFTHVAETEVERTLELLHKKDLAPEARDEAIRRLGHLIVNKLLHQPQMALKATDPAAVDTRVEATVALFGIDPSPYEPHPSAAEPAPEAPAAPADADPEADPAPADDGGPRPVPVKREAR